MNLGIHGHSHNNFRAAKPVPALESLNVTDYGVKIGQQDSFIPGASFQVTQAGGDLPFYGIKIPGGEGAALAPQPITNFRIDIPDNLNVPNALGSQDISSYGIGIDSANIDPLEPLDKIPNYGPSIGTEEIPAEGAPTRLPFYGIVIPEDALPAAAEE